MYIYIYIYIHTHTNVYIYIYIYIYIIGVIINLFVVMEPSMDVERKFSFVCLYMTTSEDWIYIFKLK